MGCAGARPRVNKPIDFWRTPRIFCVEESAAAAAAAVLPRCSRTCGSRKRCQRWRVSWRNASRSIPSKSDRGGLPKLRMVLVAGAAVAFLASLASPAEAQRRYRYRQPYYGILPARAARRPAAGARSRRFSNSRSPSRRRIWASARCRRGRCRSSCRSAASGSRCSATASGSRRGRCRPACRAIRRRSACSA